MTRIATDQGEKESGKSVPICAIDGSKQTDGGLPQMAKQLKKKKALAGFGSTGHSGSHIQSAQVNPFIAPGIP